MSENTAAFTSCWNHDAPRVLAYARRHIGDDEAPDVVAETFMVAWRRWAEVPDPPIGWLIRTASGVIRNRLRSRRRRGRLEARIALLDHVATSTDTADAVVRRDEALKRLAALTEEQRETLLLVTWDGLSPDEAATVLNLKPSTFRKRLSRARELIQRDDPGEGSRVSCAQTPITCQETS